MRGGTHEDALRRAREGGSFGSTVAAAGPLRASLVAAVLAAVLAPWPGALVPAGSGGAILFTSNAQGAAASTSWTRTAPG
jgi:hypothetical protein